MFKTAHKLIHPNIMQFLHTNFKYFKTIYVKLTASFTRNSYRTTLHLTRNFKHPYKTKTKLRTKKIEQTSPKLTNWLPQKKTLPKIQQLISAAGKTLLLLRHQTLTSLSEPINSRTTPTSTLLPIFQSRLSQKQTIGRHKEGKGVTITWRLRGVGP